MTQMLQAKIFAKCTDTSKVISAIEMSSEGMCWAPGPWPTSVDWATPPRCYTVCLRCRVKTMLLLNWPCLSLVQVVKAIHWHYYITP